MPITYNPEGLEAASLGPLDVVQPAERTAITEYTAGGNRRPLNAASRPIL